MFKLARFHLWNHTHPFTSMKGWIKTNAGFFSTFAVLEEYSIGNNNQDQYPVEKISKRQYPIGKTHRFEYGNCTEGKLKQALDVLAHFGIGMELKIYAELLHQCSKEKALAEGKLVHTHMIKTGTNPNRFVTNHLLNMYVKCGNLQNGRQVFEKMPERNVVSWTAVISGYVQHGCGNVAIEFFGQMLKAGAKANEFTFASVLAACSSVGLVDHGKQVHLHIIMSGLEGNVFLGNSLVTMYANCGSMEDARKAFDGISEMDVVSQNAMISGYLKHGLDWDALKVFGQVQQVGVGVDEFTFASVLAACASQVAVEQGKAIHGLIIKTRFISDVFVGSALVDMYAKCGCIEDSQKVFDKTPEKDIVMWNSMISGCSLNEHCEEAMKLFHQMLSLMKPDKFSLTSILSGCICPEYIKYGKQLHAHIIHDGLDSNLDVSNALVTMYARCGSIDNARLVFEKLPERNVVSWTAMIAGYVQQKHDEEALKVFCKMQKTGMKPNELTSASSLRACGNLAALENGRQVLAQTIKMGFVTNVTVGNALVKMYAQCGSIEDARKVFHSASERDVGTWNAMIAGSAQHGHGKEALQVFEKMQSVGMKPDAITFVCVLSACRHAGLVSEARYYFHSMSCDYGIEPRGEHYACMVDLLGRMGQLGQAMDFIKQIPIEPGASVWRTLLGACRVHGNMELGKFAAERILELEPQVAETYVLLSNIYAAAGKWDKATKLRNLMKERGVIKEPGCSWIEVQNKVHAFTVRDWSHSQMDVI